MRKKQQTLTFCKLHSQTVKDSHNDVIHTKESQNLYYLTGTTGVHNIDNQPETANEEVTCQGKYDTESTNNNDKDPGKNAKINTVSNGKKNTENAVDNGFW